MQRLLKILSSALLLFNGSGAVYGGLNLILHPDGSSIKLSSEWLKHTPFSDYLIPGIILLITNGLFSLFILLLLVINYRNSFKFIIVQGILLTGWIIVQIMLIRTVYFLHIILGFVGIALILLGWLQRKSGII